MAYTRLKAVPKPSSSKSYSGAKVYDKEEAKAGASASKKIWGSEKGYKQSKKIVGQEETKAAKASKKVESKANKQLKTGKKTYT